MYFKISKEYIEIICDLIVLWLYKLLNIQYITLYSVLNDSKQGLLDTQQGKI